MKKSYVKPQVLFEDFQLSASIANGCTPDIWLQINSSRGTCGYSYTGMTLFTDGDAVCKKENGGTPVKDDGTYGVCYHVPEETYRLFTSA